MVHLDNPPDPNIIVRKFIDNGKWNTNILTGVVTPITLNKVLGFPIPFFNNTVDSIIWSFTTSGQVTVKSDYNFFMANSMKNVGLSHPL